MRACVRRTRASAAVQIQKGVRKSMGISLKDAVVVLDEAHNIEDACREAARCVRSRRLPADPWTAVLAVDACAVLR